MAHAPRDDRRRRHGHGLDPAGLPPCVRRRGSGVLTRLRRVCVYCGSRPGHDPAHARAAAEVARLLTARGSGIVYGGGDVGLMGVVADTALADGGDVVGVIPRALAEMEVAHQGLTELRVVGSMHERKLEMADAADAFIALPGGVGTLEEIIEVVTWSQVGIHDKPCSLLNVNGYYDHLLAFLDHAVAGGFLRPDHRAALLVEEDPAALLDALEAWRPTAPGPSAEPVGR